MENINTEQGTRKAIWGLAVIGSLAGSILIGVLGILLTMINYPNAPFERGAALVGAVCGSTLSIPIGIFGGGIAGTFLLNALLRRNKPHPAVAGRVAAFVIGALISAVVLVPVGFVFFALGHI